MSIYELGVGGEGDILSMNENGCRKPPNNNTWRKDKLLQIAF